MSNIAFIDEVITELKAFQPNELAILVGQVGVDLELRKAPLEPIVYRGVGIWKMRDLILYLYDSKLLSDVEFEYLCYRMDEIVFENYALSTTNRWSKSGLLTELIEEKNA